MAKVSPDEITLPKSATMLDIVKLEEELAQAAGIEEHPYIFLLIDKYRIGSSPLEYGIQSVRIWAVCPSYESKTLHVNRPKNGEFILSIASLKKKIEKLETWYQSQKNQKDKEIQDQKKLVEQCRADGLPMYGGSSHWFEAMNGRMSGTRYYIKAYPEWELPAIAQAITELAEENFDDAGCPEYGESEWENLILDCIKVSEQYPLVLFSVYGEGELLSRHDFHGGDLQDCWEHSGGIPDADEDLIEASELNYQHYTRELKNVWRS